MVSREDLIGILTYGPSGSVQECREVTQSHLQLLNKLDDIKTLCVATKNDASEIRWVRIFAGELIDRIEK